MGSVRLFKLLSTNSGFRGVLTVWEVLCDPYGDWSDVEYLDEYICFIIFVRVKKWLLALRDLRPVLDYAFWFG